MNYEKRASVLYGVLVLLVSMLTARLYNLSIPEKNESMTVLDGQYTARIDVCERTGFIYDINGELLSHDLAGKTALVNPAVCTDAAECARILSECAKVSTRDDIFRKINEGIPFTVLLNQDAEVLTAEKLDGVYVFDLYDENTTTAQHLLGYFNADGKGVGGIRGEYNGFLGQSLYSKVYATFETNAKNVSMSPFELYSGKYNSEDGIVTTIDKGIQMFCDGLEPKIVSGAVIVSQIQNGKISAMSSFPSYDAKNMQMLLDSDKGELVNRCISSFTPGSVFKIVVAAAALEFDESLWEMKYTCKGTIQIGDTHFRCHKHSGHGEQTMSEAFANSCNTYFINLGRTLGLERIVKTAKKLQLNVPANADFLWENTNYFIDTESDSEQYLAQISFGQGDLCLSPLDMISVVNAVSSGFLTPLSVIEKEVRNGTAKNRTEYEKIRIFKENTCEKMLIMMEKCVEEGTGRTDGADSVKGGGKTATAQTGRYSADGGEYVHKWFCGVYPSENPVYSVCILMDYSTENSLSPAVVFSELCSYLEEISE